MMSGDRGDIALIGGARNGVELTVAYRDHSGNKYVETPSLVALILVEMRSGIHAVILPNPQSATSDISSFILETEGRWTDKTLPVNDPAPIPKPHPSEGSYHWTFERCVFPIL